MTPRQRIMATLRGERVDRPAVNFYEINGLTEDPSDPDPYNIFNHPSWRPLIELARDHTDRIVMRGVPMLGAPPNPVADLTTVETRTDENGSRLVTRTVRAPGRTLTHRSRRDRDVNTVWTLEHLLKDADDLEAWLALPEPEPGGEPDVSYVLDAERKLGESGIVMIDTADPLCPAADLFELGQYTVIAMTEKALFRRALDRFARQLYPRTEAVAKALPGRLWRIYGPEYASPPYLPPALFREYVVEYVRPMVDMIHRHGGFVRIHCHGRLRDILDDLCATGCDGIDPVEPPPQGDVPLRYVRERYGRRLVLFGNLEISDIESLETPDFERVVRRSIEEGTAGEGRGFVLQPSACPYGRVVAERTLRNYRTIVEVVESL